MQNGGEDGRPLRWLWRAGRSWSSEGKVKKGKRQERQSKDVASGSLALGTPASVIWEAGGLGQTPGLHSPILWW